MTPESAFLSLATNRRRRRRSTTERGLGSSHQRNRSRWARVVVGGAVARTRWGPSIARGEAWDLDHRDDRSGYLGPAHASCNRRAGALLKVAPALRSRRW
jgi:hypothetical protein